MKYNCYGYYDENKKICQEMIKAHITDCLKCKDETNTTKNKKGTCKR